MANICINQYRFIFTSGEKAKKFFDFLEKGSPDLGDLLDVAKIYKSKEHCARETINAVEFGNEPTEIRIDSESCWMPFVSSWDKLAKSFDNKVKTYYEAEEPCNELYYTNDPNYTNSYIVDLWDEDKIPSWLNVEYYETKDELIHLLKRLIKIDNNNLSSLLFELKKTKFDDVIDIHKIKYADIKNWD